MFGTTYDHLCSYIFIYDSVWQHKLAYMDIYGHIRDRYDLIYPFMIQYITMPEHIRSSMFYI